jgi:hypothetical protein
LPSAIHDHIIEYVFGIPDGPDTVDHVKDIAIESIFFVLNTQFAPEIRSIITRQQLITWVNGFAEERLRPYNQPRPHGRYPGRAAALLRPIPKGRDRDWSGANIEQAERTPQFLSLEDITSQSTIDSQILNIIISRQENSDNYVEVGRDLPFDTLNPPTEAN